MTGETAVDEVLLSYLVNIYPNPTIGNVFIEASDFNSLENISLFAVTGELVLSNNPTKNDDKIVELDLTDIHSGKYLLTCLFGAKKVTRIIIVK